MTKNKYRIQDEDAILQIETLKEGLETLMMDPKLGILIDNMSNKVLCVWKDGELQKMPEYRDAINYELDQLKKEPERNKYKQLLDQRFLELIGLEGWENLADNMVHEMHSPEDFDDMEAGSEGEKKYDESLDEAIEGIGLFLMERFGDIRGHEYKIIRVDNDNNEEAN